MRVKCLAQEHTPMSMVLHVNWWPEIVAVWAVRALLKMFRCITVPQQSDCYTPKVRSFDDKAILFRSY